MKIKTAVLVSGGGTNLQALIDNNAAQNIPMVELTLVVSSNAEAYALTRAENAGISFAVCPRKGRTQEEFEKELLSILEANGIEMLVLAGFMCILSAEFISHYPDRIINIHPSLIPSFCGEGYYGLHVHEAALAKGVKVTGATVHLVNEIPDGGRILLQRAVNVEDGDTPEALQKRVMEQAEWKLLPKAAQLVALRIAKEKKA